MVTDTELGRRYLELLVDTLDIPPSLYERAVKRHHSLGEWLCRDASRLKQTIVRTGAGAARCAWVRASASAPWCLPGAHGCAGVPGAARRVVRCSAIRDPGAPGEAEAPVAPAHAAPGAPRRTIEAPAPRRTSAHPETLTRATQAHRGAPVRADSRHPPYVAFVSPGIAIGYSPFGSGCTGAAVESVMRSSPGASSSFEPIACSHVTSAPE